MLVITYDPGVTTSWLAREHYEALRRGAIRQYYRDREELALTLALAGVPLAIVASAIGEGTGRPRPASPLGR